MTAPLPFAWPYALVFWPVYVWVFSREFRLLKATPMRGPGPAEDRGSLRVVLYGFSAAVLAAFVLPFVAPRATLPGSRVTWFVIGIALFVAGGLLRRHCFRVLGAFFTGAVTIQSGHRVIDTGAYRFVRHPSYSAGLLIVLGIALAAGNWLGVLVSLVTAFVVYTHRARVEEQALLGALGDEYARFLATRHRFIPFIVSPRAR